MHTSEFITSSKTISSAEDDQQKIDNLKEIISDGDHRVFVFIYMDGCGHCEAAEEAWMEFIDKIASKSNTSAYAISNTEVKHLDGALGEEPMGFPTFRKISGKEVSSYNGNRSADDFIKWTNDEDTSEQKGGAWICKICRKSRKGRKGRKGKKSRKGSKSSRKSRKSKRKQKK